MEFLSHPALKDAASAVAVIVVVILFLREQRTTNKAFLKALADNTDSRDKETTAFTGAIVSLVSLCQQMVSRCQGGVDFAEQVKPIEVIQATKESTK